MISHADGMFENLVTVREVMSFTGVFAVLASFYTPLPGPLPQGERESTF
jgi:hypothetical protein